jgi:hypothetical protein
MEIGRHVVRIVKDSPNRPGKVVPKVTVPNSSDSPDVITYVEREADSGYHTRIYEACCVGYLISDINAQ